MLPATLEVAPDTRADIALALSEACANVIQHAGPGEEYEVRVNARDGQCTIEVDNTGNGDGEPAPDGSRSVPSAGPPGDGPTGLPFPVIPCRRLLSTAGA